MKSLFFELLLGKSSKHASKCALVHKDKQYRYEELEKSVRKFANFILDLNVKKHQRVAIYLPKQVETVISFFGSSLAGAVFVPVNPLLKPHQVIHILQDCNVELLVTNHTRFKTLIYDIQKCQFFKACDYYG